MSELIAFIGVGNMGNPMAENLIKGGKKIRVYDVSKEMIEKAKKKNVDMASAIIAGIPTLIVYVLAGKYFIRGLTSGAVKG